MTRHMGGSVAWSPAVSVIDLHWIAVLGDWWDAAAAISCFQSDSLYSSNHC